MLQKQGPWRTMTFALMANNQTFYATADGRGGPAGPQRYPLSKKSAGKRNIPSTQHSVRILSYHFLPYWSTICVHYSMKSILCHPAPRLCNGPTPLPPLFMISKTRRCSTHKSNVAVWKILSNHLPPPTSHRYFTFEYSQRSGHEARVHTQLQSSLRGRKDPRPFPKMGLG